jgi:hypothetical protein
MKHEWHFWGGTIMAAGIAIAVAMLPTMCRHVGSIGTTDIVTNLHPALAAVPEDDRNAILREVIRDVLANPQLEPTRQFYGTTGDRRLALVSNPSYGIPWPVDFDPQVPGCTVVRTTEAAEENQPKSRLLGIRLDWFDLGKKANPLFDGPVHITILNAGGSGATGVVVVGGCSVCYQPVKDGTNWTAKFLSALDP